FVTAAESITLANQTLSLPGLGSYIGTAILAQNKTAILYAIVTMFLVILLYDQLLFRPLVVWSQKFKIEEIQGETVAKSLVWDLFRRTLLFKRLEFPLEAGLRRIRQIFPHRIVQPAIKSPLWRRLTPKIKGWNQDLLDWLWYGLLSLLAIYLLYRCYVFAHTTIGLGDIGQIILLGSYTALRVVAMIILILLIWVPLGVAIGLRPRLAQFIQPLAQILAAFPANLYFPWITVMIIYYHLQPNIWVSFLMILGSQWYLLFNVIAGTMAFPQDLRDAAKCFKIKGFLWWRKVILPGILPYILTGVITAAGGAWNAAIIAELSDWGASKVSADGLGAYIAKATKDGNLAAVLVGTIVMSCFVIAFNRLIWRPLYDLTAKKMRLG
ncbi:MAG: ABC transporter permease subunit, partial [Candidatus Pacebacteria bacterium]|nr:ABC transporter permease subunit [Candidatus Paceibacterota bacterium]